MMHNFLCCNENKHKLVSVLMPVFNSADYIERSILSIVNQTYSNYELIIIDDGSTDHSSQIIKEFIKLYPTRIKYIYKNNSGIVDSLNLGLKYCSGVYIARMDSDDIALSDRLMKQVTSMENDEDLMVLGGQMKTFGYGSSKISSYPESDIDCKELLMIAPCFSHPTVMFRGRIFKEYNFKYSNLYPNAEDYALWLDLAKNFKFQNLPDVLILYRQHENQVSTKTRQIQIHNHGLLSCAYILSTFNVNLNINDFFCFLRGNPTEFGYFKTAFNILKLKTSFFMMKIILFKFVKDLINSKIVFCKSH